MKKLIFATNNLNKLKEIKNAVSNYEIISLDEMGINEEIPETGKTLHDNALQKAVYIYQKTGKDCFADDTGLEIATLDNKPGVYSARYAGDNCSPDDNMNRVLNELKDTRDRNALFRTVIALIINGEKYFFEGSIDGTILEAKTGSDGFGYDPIFQPNGFDLSFAEMSLGQKNSISHRANAVKKLIHFLNEI
jgi:XTP/dITP diphosphohydrolase